MNKVIVAPKDANGPLAQLGERLHGMEEVIGSSPTRSTKMKTKPRVIAAFLVFLLFGLN